MIPCPLCGLLQDDPWMNFHLINGHGFAGGPGIPSPVAIPPARSSEGVRDGGRGASDSASGSPGRPSEKGGQRSPQGQGGAIAPKPVSEADKTAPVSQDDLALATDWMQAHFYQKKGSPGAIGDEWRDLVAACKALGLKDKEPWRDWVHERWNAKGEAQASVVRMLKLAGVIKSAAPESPTTIGLKDDVRAAAAKITLETSAPAKSLLKMIDASAGVSITDELLIAQCGFPSKGAYEVARDILLDAGLAYEPRLGTLQSMKGADRPKGG